jgi:hypothetical protein
MVSCKLKNMGADDASLLLKKSFHASLLLLLLFLAGYHLPKSPEETARHLGMPCVPSKRASR